MRSLNAGAVKTQKSEVWREAPAYKWRSTKEGITLSIAQGIMMPEVLRQPTADELKQSLKVRQTRCHRCKKEERKYVCAKTQRVSCSFECYKAMQVK